MAIYRRMGEEEEDGRKVGSWALTIEGELAVECGARFGDMAGFD
jgi:hypothetical protein